MSIAICIGLAAMLFSAVIFLFGIKKRQHEEFELNKKWSGRFNAEGLGAPKPKSYVGDYFIFGAMIFGTSIYLAWFLN